MFFMGEEIGAQKQYTFNNFLSNREDILGETTGNGKALFRFYRDLISLSRRLRSIRSHNVDTLHQSNGNRVIAFKRWSGDEQVIILGKPQQQLFHRWVRHRERLRRHSERGMERGFQQRCRRVRRPERRQWWRDYFIQPRPPQRGDPRRRSCGVREAMTASKPHNRRIAIAVRRKRGGYS
jgi:hypothetical protein